MATDWVFPGFQIDQGFATVTVAFVPALIGIAGFWLRLRHVRKRLAAGLLAEVRLKLGNLDQTESWITRAEEMVRNGTIPRLVIEPKQDVIFGSHQSELTNIPASALFRIVSFYKLDDFVNLALDEVKGRSFEEAGTDRQITHLLNVKTLLLPAARRSGRRAEFALSVVSGMTVMQELTFSRRRSSTFKSHAAKLRRYKTAYRERRSPRAA